MSEPMQESKRDVTRQSRQWAMFLHFSLLTGYFIPFAGLIIPILIWQLKKNDFPELDAHGKVVMNWIISSLIYGSIGFVLTFIFIGLFILIPLGILFIVFPIIGGIKANDGEVWKYPFSIRFLK